MIFDTKHHQHPELPLLEFNPGLAKVRLADNLKIYHSARDKKHPVASEEELQQWRLRLFVESEPKPK